MEASHAETSAAGARRLGWRLTPEARKLLTDFAEQVTRFPDSHQRQQLLEEVRRSSGCALAAPGTISTWFQRYRSSTKKKTEDDNLLFPNLAPKQLDVLRTLLRNNPTPAKDMIDIWAACIKGELEDVRMWVSYQQAKVLPRGASDNSMSASPTEPHPHLPTPARSLSPPRVRDMSLPLIATKEESSPPGTPLSEGWPTHAANVSPTNSPQYVTDELDELRSQFTQIPAHGGLRPVSIISNNIVYSKLNMFLAL
ncbi:hypothetical protein K503DRAFT_284504 [Rhizopogon vinicolor AM-OR11-026]|uniref:Homeobox domain-containing protein n=1 Tax=Rhizopogon vinicolor AM-OR11-026 TaxID=1314800 RepID=A0A1B7ND93_9AGAM|nr:hypothetical protein K503DRAFT_284504 [Rhizopogon vinicolor AM-OR11-026]